MAQSVAPDVDAALEQAWQNLYAKHPQLHASTPPASEAVALSILREAGAELMQAAVALHNIAQTLKLQPNMQPIQRLQLANFAIQASGRARQAAQGLA